MLYWDDVSDSFDGWMNLLRQLGGDSFINFEQDIWETARTYETVPHFGNLRQHHLLGVCRIPSATGGRSCGRVF